MGHTALTAVDILVIVVYLAVVVAKGFVLSKGQHSVKDYFLAGRRMSYWVVAISTLASLLSAITFMGAPTEAYVYDLKYSMAVFTVPLILPIVIYVFLPFFYKLNLYTAYQYLERRFHLSVRTVASLFFVFWRLTWMALVVFGPSLAISTFFNVDWRICVVAVGIASTAYTVMGGMTAVMWTDVIQFFVLYGGAFMVIVVAVLRTDGGLTYLWNAAYAQGKLTLFDWTWSPFQRMGTWAIILGQSVGYLAAYATDQVAIQRYLTSKSFDEARRSLRFYAWIIVPAALLFYWMGTILWGFYHQQPELLAGFDTTHMDRILPWFIVQQLPVGIRGVLIAALFAATMSSMDSGINSLTTTTLVDFYEGLFKRKYEQAAHLLLARKWTVAWGVVGTALAIAAGVWGSLLMETSVKVSGLFMGPLLGMFLLGMLTKRANWQGALLGAAIGFFAALVTAFGTIISGWFAPPSYLHDVSAGMGKVTFLYYTTIGAGLTMAAGLLLSCFFAPPRPEQIARPEELTAD